MRFFPTLLLLTVFSSPLVAQPVIEEGDYEGRPHFIVKTAAATLYYDKAGGGFSRLVDRQGNDWIAFRGMPAEQYPQAAAGAFRGMPNLVYGSADSGAGHPGFDQCESVRVGPNAIRTASRSGKWRWRWTFYEEVAELIIEKVDPEHPYWFLYEGTVAGAFRPQQQYWGSSDSEGPRTDIPDYYQGNKVTGDWEWVYFGEKRLRRVLFLAMRGTQGESFDGGDGISDTFSYLGNSDAGAASSDGMVVFGFGRADEPQPLLTKPAIFYIGFLDQPVRNQRQHQKAGDEIKEIMNRHRRHFSQEMELKILENRRTEEPKN